MKLLSIFISVCEFIDTPHANIATIIDVAAVVLPSIQQVLFNSGFGHESFLLAENKRYLSCDPVPGVPGGITIFDDTTSVRGICLGSIGEIQERVELILLKIDCSNKARYYSMIRN